MRCHHQLILIAAAVIIVGCATSPQFQRMSAHVLPHLADDATRYVTADATLDDATRTARLSEVSALRQSTATTQAVTDQGVYAAWAQVSPWYRAYILADPKLPADYKADRIGRCDKLDAAIAGEAKRSFGASTQPVAQ